MPQRVDERVRPITPQLAWRVAVLGGIAFVLFGIVFFRLWYLQVLTGEQSKAIAGQNRSRKVPIQAPRGAIVDTNGQELVTTRAAAVVQMVPADLPLSVRTEADDYRKALAAAANEQIAAQDRHDAFERQLRDDGRKSRKSERRQLRALAKAADKPRPVGIPPVPPDEANLIKLYRRMGKVLGMKPATIHERVIRGIADAPYSNVTIKVGVPLPAFNHMREYSEDFPGIVVAKQFVRYYPHGDLAAQLFGTVSQIHSDQLKLSKYKGATAGTQVGQSGLEEWYDKYLRGINGYSKLVVNALGSRDQQARTSVKEPQQGESVKLTLDLNLQRVGDQALDEAIAAAHQNGANAGAYVAMDPTNGAILAMGSKPGFDANLLAKPFSQKTYDALTSKATGVPLLDRATESAYPTGSTFKPVTAFASLAGGLISANTKVVDDGTFQLGPQKYQNAKNAKFGSLDMSDALKVSSDIFFFRLGAAADSKGDLIQRWARRFGFGHKTGIDLPGESAGLVPDREWRHTAYSTYLDCVNKAHLTPQTTAALYKCGGIERDWSTGDDVNLAVGQGDLQATPLQLAVAYAAIANGGTIVRPHLGEAIEDGFGRTVQELPKKPRRKIKFNAADRNVILEGLRRAVNEPNGTSADVFKGFKGPTVYGKTGTAQRGINPDQAWYACFVKDGGRPIVVVVTVEKGGFGAETAAPAARLILSQWFDLHDDKFTTGTNQSN